MSRILVMIIFSACRAVVFRAEVGAQGSAEAQQLMARVTGNYRRGNERLAGQHPRNRR